MISIFFQQDNRFQSSQQQHHPDIFLSYKWGFHSDFTQSLSGCLYQEKIEKKINHPILQSSSVPEKKFLKFYGTILFWLIR